MTRRTGVAHKEISSLRTSRARIPTTGHEPPQPRRLLNCQTNPDLAELFIDEDHIGELFRDTDEGELSYDFSMNFHTDADQLQAFMKDRFKLDSIEVRQRVNKDDSAEVYIADEFIGVLFEEDGVHSYAFNMSILDYDLAET